MQSQREKKEKRACAQGKLPLSFRGESIKTNVWMGNCSFVTPAQTSSLRGVFGMGIAHETPQTRQVPKRCNGPSVSAVLGMRAHCCYVETSYPDPLTVTPIFSNDLWQISVTKKSTALEKQVTCS